MHEPVSHTAAVVSAVSLILLTIMAWSAAGIPRAARSPAWWGAGLLVAFILASSLVTYFRPHANVSPVPLVVSGVVLLALCVWASWAIVQAGDTRRIYYPVVYFSAWVAWVGRKFVQWRAARARAAGRQQRDSDPARAATPR